MIQHKSMECLEVSTHKPYNSSVKMCTPMFSLIWNNVVMASHINAICWVEEEDLTYLVRWPPQVQLEALTIEHWGRLLDHPHPERGRGVAETAECRVAGPRARRHRPSWTVRLVVVGAADVHGRGLVVPDSRRLAIKVLSDRDNLESTSLTIHTLF